MTNVTNIDLEQLARRVDLPLEKTTSALELLDEGNTVAFMTRYRKDQTGGLDEEQIRQIAVWAGRLRQIAERKEAILKSIDAQGKLTDRLRGAIEQADSTKRLEDLYLPFKPKKQTLATQARARGLQPLADAILACEVTELETEAEKLVGDETGLSTAEDVLHGVSHILAESFSERPDIRVKLRRILRDTGCLVTTQITTSVVAKEEAGASDSALPDVKPTESSPSASSRSASEATDAPGKDNQDNQDSPEMGNSASPERDGPVKDGPVKDGPVKDGPVKDGPVKDGPTKDSPTKDSPVASVGTTISNTAVPPKKRRRKSKTTRVDAAYQDYFDYSEPLSRVPHHRVLAINRGERAKVLRVRIEGDQQRITAAACDHFVTAENPNGRFLSECVRDALARLIVPSLEREFRREMTERAEEHAVKVFAKNLRNLLLQPPIRGRRVLAIDPGFRSGCKLAVFDEFGKLLEHGLCHLVGKDVAIARAKEILVDLVRRHNVDVIAIGNGTACRETEQWVAEVMSDELRDANISYVIVNEAGASVYSTSPAGREELPDFDPSVRSAISIGRRLLDPLSELVKIQPANIGVGMYQHDAKAKHLRESLDAVVESCVNFVGVDVNTASPALLSYVSGLNQLTARRVYEYRQEHGPFRDRQQLLDVPGIGEATFVQAAGFLKITDGDNPLDATWIHPESYDVARRLLERLDSNVTQLSNALKQSIKDTALVDRAESLDVAALANELGVGELLLHDLLNGLTRPGRDPRDDLPLPVFRTGIMKLDDLKAGLELKGTVLNVVDFGVFVDIGICDSALVHISRLANRFVRDPHEVFSVGDVATVWVVAVDKDRRRVSLTAIPPGSEVQQTRETKRRSTTGAPVHQRPTRPRPVTRSKQNSAAGQRVPRPKFSKRNVKPPAPISDAMADGKEPLRSFSDLMQFYEQKKSDDDDAKT